MLSKRRPIRVWILFSVNDLGGAERSLTRMALANDDESVVYQLATLGSEGRWSAWVRSLGAKPRVFDRGILGWLGAVVELLKALRRDRPDVVYLIGLRAAFVVRMLRPLLRGVRMVHGIRSSFPPGSDLARRFRWERVFRRFTTAYIANSKAGAESFAELIGMRKEDVRVIPNGLSVVDPVKSQASREKKLIAVVANIHPLKGHREFLDVLELVTSKHPDVRIKFIGRDDLSGQIQREVKARKLDSTVEFCGFQPDISPYLLQANLFVLPSSITEGAPTSILEALAAGIPAVAYAIGGIPELICDGVDGYLVAVGDTSGMANAIVGLIEDSERAKSMGLAGWAKVEREYSLRLCAERHAVAWREICEERK